MKKVSVLFVVLAMTAIVGFACGGDSATPTSRPTATTAAPTATSPAVEEPTATTPPVDDHDDVEIGKQLATAKACVACHSTDGSSIVGPTWKGLYGSIRELEDGSTVTADESYLEESILTPTAKVVKGFAPLMPPTPLTDDELHSIIAYIKSLE